MHRLMTKRDKNGSHRRSKSSDPKVEKVMSAPESFCIFLTPDGKVSASQDYLSSPVTSICAAFPAPHGKRSPSLEVTLSTIYATLANKRPYSALQPRPLSSFTINFFDLFRLSEKAAGDKKPDKADAKKVRIQYPPSRLVLCLAKILFSM
jgi:hypothetical protein